MSISQSVFANSLMTDGGFPARHGADPGAWKNFIRPLRPLFPGRAIPDRDLCDAYGHALLRGDKPMDDLVAWMQAEGMAQTRPLFRQALEQGIDSVPDAPAPLKEFFALVDKKPDWLDEGLLQRGAEAYAMLGGDVLYASRDFVLMGGYLSSSINEVLYRVGGLERGANRRVAETADWYLKMVQPDAMTRFGDGFKSTIHVRFVHALVRQRITNLPDWDVSKDGIAVNQTDMVGTWLGGSIAAFIGAMLLGRLTVSYGDLRAALHLFRYSHWLMGVEDEFLTDDPREAAYRLANLVLMQPGPTEVCRQMAVALAEHPMQVEYDRLQGLRRRWKRHTLLSRNRYFLRREGIERLGLPRVMPWWPMLTAPPKALWFLSRRFLVPGQRRRLVARGRAEQQHLLDEVYGRQHREINPEAVGRTG